MNGYSSTFTNAASSPPVTFASVMEVAAKMRAMPTLHGPIVLTEAQLRKIPREDVRFENFVGLNISGMPVVTVGTDHDVMPMVHKLRRRGKRPIFVGMIEPVAPPRMK